MDFLGDLIIGVGRELGREGVTVPSGLKNDPVALLAAYGEYHLRKIQEEARVVHRSAALKASPFLAKFSNAVDNLESLAVAGGDIGPYQSKSIDKFEYSEALLFDWGIQHLHLGSLRKGAKFCDRTGPLLFAIFKPGAAYFIDILDHGKWAELGLLNTVEKEWPQLLQPFILRGGIDIPQVPTADDTLKLRKAGVTVLQKLDSGKIIVSPGGGITAARTSMAAMEDAQRMAKVARLAESVVMANESAVRAKLEAGSGEAIRLACISYPERYVIVTTEKGGKLVRVNF